MNLRLMIDMNLSYVNRNSTFVIEWINWMLINWMWINWNGIINESVNSLKSNFIGSWIKLNENQFNKTNWKVKMLNQNECKWSKEIWL